MSPEVEDSLPPQPGGMNATEPFPNEAAAAEATGDDLIHSCPDCGTLLDISEEEPFAHVHCPICGAAMRVRTRLKNFVLLEVLGAGGMGAVYKACDVNLNRLVALKVVRKEYSSDPVYLERFEREARITAAVNHPHVLKVFSFGSDHGLVYIAMELVDKGSLDERMTRERRIPEIEALDVGIQIAQGLRAAQARGLIHRDVKPGNILFADAHTAKIVDFGLAVLAEHAAETQGEVWGTPYYVAPEKLAREPEDFRSDIYSLGATLFHAIAGRPPFDAQTPSMTALKHLKSRSVSLQSFVPAVSSATAYVINRMMHKQPAQRYKSYDELIEHLQYAKAQLVEAAAKPRTAKPHVDVTSKRPRKWTSWIAAALIILLLVLVLAGSVFAFDEQLFNKSQTAASSVNFVKTAR